MTSGGTSRRQEYADTAMAALSYASGPADHPLLGETIGANLRRTASAHPDCNAIVVRHQDVRLTYAEFDREVDLLARGLLEAGIEPGDRVGLWSPNCVEWALVQYATARMGAILVNVNPAYRTSELDYALGQSRAKMLLAAREFKGSDCVAMIAEVGSNHPGLERAVVLGTDEWEALRLPQDAGSADRLADVEAKLQFDDPINIQYTSGTTGSPKGATLSHHNILNNAFFTARTLRYDASDRVCIPVPYYHCFGMVIGNLACTSTGACMVVPAPAFDPSATLEAVAAERCTSLYGVPTMFIAELELPDFDQYDLSSLRTGVMAGSPCPVEVMRQVADRMNMEQVTICYGMTETSPVSTQTSIDDPLDRRVSTVGHVHAHVEVKIIEPESGNVAVRGKPGELCTRGYSVMLGYWDDPERTAEAVDLAGWMHTGDLATMDEEGYVKITGRIKDMIIRGGENVYPREIEEFLHGHENVMDVQVIGVPDAKYGEEIMAWIVLRPGAAATEQEIRDYCSGRIAHFKVPRHVRFVEEFPMTVTGKVQKFRLRDRAITELGLARPVDR